MSVATIEACVSTIVRLSCRSVSNNVGRKLPSIASPDDRHCEPLHLVTYGRSEGRSLDFKLTLSRRGREGCEELPRRRDRLRQYGWRGYGHRDTGRRQWRCRRDRRYLAATLDTDLLRIPAPAGLYEAYEEALRRLPAWLSGIGYEAMGLTCLREAIARDYARRGCPTRPEQIIVTSGAQNGFTLVLRALTGPGDRIVVDHPTYHNALGAISRSSCQPVPVSLPQTGWDLGAMDAAFRQAGPRFAYLLPDFHNPTGRLMDDPARRELVTIAARTRTPLLIDETMVETGLTATAPAPVAAHDPDGHRIISLGSASKRYWGGLRIGWIRASEQRIAEFGRLRAILDMATPVLEQLAVTVMLERDRRTEDRRALMRARCDKLIALLADALPHWRAPVPEGGLALWAELPRAEASALAAMAQSLGLRIAPGPRFAVDGAFERFVRLPFTLSESDLQRAVERLAQADRSLHRRAAHRLDGPAWTIEADRVI